MSRALVVTTTEVRDRLKRVAKNQSVSVLNLATVILNEGLVPFEEGRAKLTLERVVTTNKKGGAK